MAVGKGKAVAREKEGDPVKYPVHHRKPVGQEYNIQLTVGPVIPKLINGNLFGN